MLSSVVQLLLCCVLTSGKSLLMLSPSPFPLLYIVQPRRASGKTTNKFQRGGRHRCSIGKTHMLIVNTGGPLHRFREYVTEPERQRAERPSLSDAYCQQAASDSDKPRLARKQDENTTRPGSERHIQTLLILMKS